MNYFYLNLQKEQLLFIEDQRYHNAVIDNIILLHEDLRKNILEKRLAENLAVGIWNLREFGNSKYGGRVIEALYYNAEIISKFDLIAIQEVGDNLSEFNSVCRILRTP
jgi:hypothetical protein